MQLSENGNSKDQEVVTTGKYEDTEDNITKHAVIYIAFFKIKLKVTIKKWKLPTCTVLQNAKKSVVYTHICFVVTSAATKYM